MDHHGFRADRFTVDQFRGDRFTGDQLSADPFRADPNTTGLPGDVTHLHRALTLAARGPAVDPNPRVGAVIVDASGAVVGEGWHAGAGTPHAEAVALAGAGGRARGATAYVSLEPCRHTGRTAPCTHALVAAGITRVVFAQADPNPLAGGGAAELRSAGMEALHLGQSDPGHSADRLATVAESIGARAAALNDAWAFAMRHGRPRVIWKTATTLDGRSAAADGTSQWITAPETRAAGHRLRAECGAILVGTGTAYADNPRLTIRLDEHSGAPGQHSGARAQHSGAPARPPLRVVLGERDLPPEAALRDGAAPTLHLRHHDPARALATLHERGVRQVLLEGGPTLAAAFWRAGLIDRVVFHLAPRLLGAGLALGDFGVGTLADAPQLVIQEVRRSGPDLIVVADAQPTRPDLEPTQHDLGVLVGSPESNRSI